MPLAYPFEARTRRVADLTEAIARRLAPSAAEHDRRGDFALDNLAALHEAGYLRLALPLRRRRGGRLRHGRRPADPRARGSGVRACRRDVAQHHWASARRAGLA